MIQIIHIDVPLGDKQAEPLIATLSASLQRMQVLYPALLGCAVDASDRALHISLRVAGSDRWNITRSARTIATSMLRRVKLDVSTATVARTETPPNARSLTLATGRNPNHTPRGHAKRRWNPEP